MSKHQYIRNNVSSSYARAVNKQSSCGCCCGGGATEQKGVVAKLGGYSDEELRALPADAVINSFGCGNPVAMSAITEGQTVLDLGSGAGIDLFLAARKVGPTGHVIGVDMTDAMVEKARGAIAAGGFKNVEVRKGIIEEMPVEDGSVDWVISNCVINLSPEKPRVFAEIARVLKPGGRMMVSDIIVEEMPDAIRQDQALYSSCVAGAIPEVEYLDGLKRAGLVDVQVVDRLVYDADQLEAFFVSELPDNGEVVSCCGTPANPALAKIARTMVGKVWSAKITARKPHKPAV